MLKKRILTASLLIPLVMLLIFTPSATPLHYAAAAITLLGAWEWTTLCGLKRFWSRLFFVALIAASLWSLQASSIEYILRFACLHWIIALGVMLRYPEKAQWWSSNIIMKAFWGWWVLVPFYLGLVTLKTWPAGEWWLLTLMCLVWGADTAAYFTGRRWGLFPLASNISPGKTREGVLGGVFAVLLIGFIVVVAWQASIKQSIFFMGLALLTGLVSVVGDLFESMLKRVVNVKDSGNLLPGHGGILDRIDALTAATPVFVYLLSWIVGTAL